MSGRPHPTLLATALLCAALSACDDEPTEREDPLAGLPSAADAPPSEPQQAASGTSPGPQTGRPSALEAEEEDAAAGLRSSEPLREADLPPDAPARIAARHIVIAWTGALKSPPTLRRTPAEARRLADETLKRLKAGADFAEVAMELSDGPSGPRGGHLGAFAAGAMHPAFDEAVFALEEGELSGVVETPFGYHLIRREPLVEVRIAHIVVQWAESNRTTTDRSKDEARLRAQEAAARLAAGEPFEAVAAELSDGPSGPRGGDLGWFQKGQMLPEFEAAAFSLGVGQTSDVVETATGFHLLYRLK